jgi:type II secretory pathway component PulK
MNVTTRQTSSFSRRACSARTASKLAGYTCAPRHQRGAVLIVALIVIAVLAGMLMVLGRAMRVEVQAAGNQTAAAQAQGAESAAEQFVLGALTTDVADIQTFTEDQFQVHVGDQGSGGTFLIVRPDYDDQSLPLYGLVEEGSKININTAGQSFLYNLIQDDDTLSAVVSWRTANSVDSYYNSLPNPYQCKAAPFESVEELLMVRGFTRQIVYGDGTAPPLGQRSNVLTANNSTAGGSQVLSDTQLARGVYDLLTIWSGPGNDPTGQPYDPTTLPDGSQRYRLDRINQISQLLALAQDQGTAQRILSGYRRNPRALPTSIFDFARAGLSDTDLDAIADYAQAPPNSAARIEVNQAPPSVLYALVGLNGIQSTDIDNLLAARQQQDPQVGTIGWVSDAIGAAAAGRLARYITNRSYFFSADIHAFSDDGRAFKRVRIVVDARTSTPEIVYRRDITDRPDQMDQLNMDSLRHGQGLAISPAQTLSSRGGIQ